MESCHLLVHVLILPGRAARLGVRLRRLGRRAVVGYLLAALVMLPLSLAGEQTEGVTWIPATDTVRVRQSGAWRTASFRYAQSNHLQTIEDGAALDVRFRGTGVILRQGGHAVPAYGSPNLGQLLVSIDGGVPQPLWPRGTPDEVVLARGLPHADHFVRLEHHRDNGSFGSRIESFGILDGPSGDLAFAVAGEENAFLVDVRAIVRSQGKIIRNSLVRNWLNGECRLAGLPPGDGYSLELHAAGWKTHRVENLKVTASAEARLPPIYLHREDATRITRVLFPALNRQAIRVPGETFRARFQGPETDVEKVRLTRSAGPAVISRQVAFQEDVPAAYYYDRELVVKVPDDMPEGLYDLSVTLSGSPQWGGVCRSPRSVHVVKEYPQDPVFMTFGHLDTSGQYQAEYLERLAEIANLLGVDMVLESTAVNPAYMAGALARLDVPFMTNFGNHQFFGHEKWYGAPVGLLDFGPDIAILNFGLPWHTGIEAADALLASRERARIKIINAFEANAPVQNFLDKHHIRFIHDGHGIGKKVTDIGATPTRRAGKVNSESFRIVRFQDGRVISCTYQNDDIAPIPFGREGAPPVRAAFSPANDGTHSQVRAEITNGLKDAFPRGRVIFVLPAGSYIADRGNIESMITSDDGRFVVAQVRIDIPAAGAVAVSVRPRD